ncbi:MAG TPA: M67 family metallopeptidase [Pyrinomonadaceae bacterium]|nr:M67 family metallopeptidase [Pyrinomonadaceae bacterium]
MSWHVTRRKLRAVRVLVIRRDLFEDVQKHVLGQYPVEACGFLAGRFDEDEATAERCIVVKNVAASADRFVLDPKEIERVRQDLQCDEELISFFHSHAKAPEPSGLDKINMRFLPLVWLIVGGVEDGIVDERGCLAFKTDRKDTLGVELRIVDGVSPPHPNLPS